MLKYLVYLPFLLFAAQGHPSNHGDTARALLSPNSQQNQSGVRTMNQTLTAIPPQETFGNTWPYEPRFSDAPGFRMHYVDEGEGENTLLLLHGEPTWAYLFRQQIAVWSQTHRVIAVDHMGFGKSETPNGRTYWLQDHIDNLERFVLDLDLKNITLVMHDFGGPTGMGLAIRHPDRIKQFISINGPTPLAQENLIELLVKNAGEAPWFKWIAKAQEEGSLERILGDLHYNILSTLKLNGFERNDIITPDWIDAYGSAFPTAEYAAGATGWAKGFATNKHIFEEPSAATRDVLAKKPALALWGEKDQTLMAKNFIPLFRSAFPQGQVIILPEAGHYSLEDAPDEISQLVSEFLAPKE